MRYAHTNLIAKNWRSLSLFYQKVFGCKPVPPERNLKGAWLERLTGMPDVHIVGEHLRLPGYGDEGPTLEIFSYDTSISGEPKLNLHGFSHIAFEVENVADTINLLLSEGGELVGEIVSREYDTLGTGTFAYAKDPEGNIIEVQSWKKRKESSAE